MIPAGYMAKHVATRPEGVNTIPITDIYSVSSCMSTDFADYVGYWKHNGYWLFDSPDIIQQVAGEHNVDLTGTSLFYYEVYECEFDEQENSWKPFTPESTFATQISEPETKNLEGYDVVTFSCGTRPECSPLSCCALAAEIETNQHCLLSSFEQAKALLEEGKFLNTEPGPFRIFAVYSVAWH